MLIRNKRIQINPNCVMVVKVTSDFSRFIELEHGADSFRIIQFMYTNILYTRQEIAISVKMTTI